MKISLKSYIQDRERLKEEKSKLPRPLLTISRQFGCKANHLAIKLISMIADYQHKTLDDCAWRYINKEIIDESAKILGFSAFKLEHELSRDTSNELGDMFRTLSSDYQINNKKLIKGIREVLDTYARKGHVIMIGRGGAALTHGFPYSLHVRLFAPIEWRAKKMAEERGGNLKEALELIKQIDLKRQRWSEHLTGRSYSDHHFDLLMNVQTMPEDEIADAIFHLMLKRKMIGKY
jgi:cytidylate kinase